MLDEVFGRHNRSAAQLHLAVTANDAKRAYLEALSFGCRSCYHPVTLELGHPPVLVKNALVYGLNGEVIEFLEKRMRSDTHGRLCAVTDRRAGI